jgi:small subunit ribosomal protein S8
VSMTDPIADLLTRIRNANAIGAKSTVVPFSKLKKEVLRVLKEQGFILDYFPEMKAGRGVLRIELKYGPDGERVIRHLQRVSRPGRRVYRAVDKIPEVLNGMGVAVVSTPKGVLSSFEARKLSVGGEVLCEVW